MRTWDKAAGISLQSLRVSFGDRFLGRRGVSGLRWRMVLARQSQTSDVFFSIAVRN